MNQHNQTNGPQNIVSNIVGKKIYLENMSSQMIDRVKEMGVIQIPYGAELIWLFECPDENRLRTTLQELNRLGFLFAGSPHGWPPAEIVADLREKKMLTGNFKEVRWRGPGDWYIIER